MTSKVEKLEIEDCDKRDFELVEVILDFLYPVLEDDVALALLGGHIHLEYGHE